MSDESKRDHAGAGPEDTAGAQFLTFVLAGEYYGVDILRVQEIRGWEAVTRIPNVPIFVKGVVNLRGAIVPIYDLRQRFGLEVQPYTKQTVVIVLRVGGERGARSAGVVVDAVSDVLMARAEQIVAPPDFGASVPTESIRGLMSHQAKMIVVLDVDSLIGQAAVDPSAAA